VKHSLNKHECMVGLYEFYKTAARTAGLTVNEKTRFDCTKICVTVPVYSAIRNHYIANGVIGCTLGGLMAVYGPKATLPGDGYKYKLKDGFVTEGN